MTSKKINIWSRCRIFVVAKFPSLSIISQGPFLLFILYHVSKSCSRKYFVMYKCYLRRVAAWYEHLNGKECLAQNRTLDNSSMQQQLPSLTVIISWLNIEKPFYIRVLTIHYIKFWETNLYVHLRFYFILNGTLLLYLAIIE